MSCNYDKKLHGDFGIFYICPSCKLGFFPHPVSTNTPCIVCGNMGYCKAIAKLESKKKIWYNPSTWKHGCLFTIKKWLEAIPSEVTGGRE